MSFGLLLWEGGTEPVTILSTLLHWVSKLSLFRTGMALFLASDEAAYIVA